MSAVLHARPRSSASAFLDSAGALADYDAGKYCFSQLVREGEWAYWGETAIPKDYVLHHWARQLVFVDYVDDPGCCSQKVMVMTKAPISG
jgi:hypothetical protein